MLLLLLLLLLSGWWLWVWCSAARLALCCEAPAAMLLSAAPPLPVSRRQLMGLWKDADVEGKWATTNLAKKRKARATRLASNDFQRFELMLAKKERAAKLK